MDILRSNADDGNMSIRICSKCQRPLPATPEFFSRDKRGKDGLRARCKQCMSTRKPSTIPEGYKLCRPCNRILPANEKFFHHAKAGKYGFHHKCKECRANLSDAEREQKRFYDAQWHKDNKDHCSEVSRYYRQTERGIIAKRTRAHNRRARKRGAVGTHTTEELYQQLKHQKGKCYYCHVKLGKGRDSWNGDHIIPLSRGGTNTIDNIVIVCPSCNFRKGTKLPHEWIEGGRLL